LAALPYFSIVSIFDWDDTILVSTFVSNAGYRVDDTFDLPADLRASLDLLEDQVLATLQAALDRGPTLVVTNAETGWVELSGKRFLPRVLKFVEDTGIKVVSARSEYEKEFPESPSDWKAQAFLNEVGAVYRDGGDLNVMVFGDSLSERIAGHALGMRQPLARIKSIKFVERPNVEQLKRQLSLVQSSFGDLWEHDGSFDVNLVC